jgi:PAS domain S-box-containing protein
LYKLTCGDTDNQTSSTLAVVEILFRADRSEFLPEIKNMPKKEGLYSLEQEDMKVHRERYRVFIENVADAFYETNLRGDFIFFNDALCRIFGRSREDIRHHNFREFMDEKNAGIAFESFNDIFRKGEGATDIRWEIISEGGEKRILEISAKLILDKEGKGIGFRGIARDITEKTIARRTYMASERRAREQYAASRRAERRYRALMDFLPDPVFVFNLDSTVSYINPAFVDVFGWSLKELEGRRIPFVPDHLKEETREGTSRLFKDKVARGVGTKRLTKDGRILDILLDAAVFYEKDEASGQVAILRDVTRQKRIDRTNQALFRIANALHRFQRLDALLDFITQEVQNLLEVGGASVIILDEEKNEFFFHAATYDDSEAGKRFREIRFPVDKGNAGHVYRTGRPVIVSDTSKSPYFIREVDEKAGYNTRNMIMVPMWIKDRMIGVLCAVNKDSGEFNQEDQDLLSTIAGTVSLPIENARINEKLKLSYEEVKSMNRAKDRVIHHLSHELKTPVSVLTASLALLSKRLSEQQNESLDKIMGRARRNLQRILDMQYQIEDILRERDYKTYYMMSRLLDVCTDELEAIVSQNLGEADAIQKIRQRIEQVYGPYETSCQEIHLNHFVENQLGELRNRFSHRKIRLVTEADAVPSIFIPTDVLSKIVDGLIRNAIENTPDGGRIMVTVRDAKEGPELEVKDFGVGITGENQRLIFDSNVTTAETSQYASKKPYDFGAGGKGFDLLRMKIFSERHDFTIRMISSRCVFIPNDEDLCPGKILDCEHCRAEQDCIRSGGTTVTVGFKPNVDFG